MKIYDSGHKGVGRINLKKIPNFNYWEEKLKSFNNAGFNASAQNQSLFPLYPFLQIPNPYYSGYSPSHYQKHWNLCRCSDN